MSVAEDVRTNAHAPAALPNTFAVSPTTADALPESMTGDPPDGDRRIDVRDIEGEPFGDIMAALESLEDAETLVLVADFEPVPLYDVLESRGFGHETTRVDEEEFHVAIEAT